MAVNETEIEFDDRVNQMMLLRDALRGLSDKQVWLIRNAPLDDFIAARVGALRADNKQP